MPTAPTLEQARKYVFSLPTRTRLRLFTEVIGYPAGDRLTMTEIESRANEMKKPGFKGVSSKKFRANLLAAATGIKTP